MVILSEAKDLLLYLKRAWLLLALAAPAAHAQWPEKPVRLVTPFSPGGGADTLARLVTPSISQALGQPIVVENKPGAGTVIGVEYAAKAEPDGYTFLIAANSMVINAALRKTRYDPVKDFAPVGMAASSAVVLAVHPSVPARNATELIAYVRANPGKIAYGDCGTGSVMHLAGELMKLIARIDMVRVTYKGCGPALTDALAGRIPVIFNTYGNTAPQAKAGKLRILGLASATRSPVDASVPTIAEAGLSGIDADIWYAVFAPAGTPDAFVRRLNAEMRATLAKPDIDEKLRIQYFDVRPGTPEALARTVRDDLARWSKVVKDANIKID